MTAALLAGGLLLFAVALEVLWPPMRHDEASERLAAEAERERARRDERAARAALEPPRGNAVVGPSAGFVELQREMGRRGWQ